MAYGIYFDKDRAEHYLDALDHGKPIMGVETVNDMLALAGACYFAALSHGPVLLPGTDVEKMPDEHRQHITDSLEADLHAAIQFYGQLTQAVRDNEYDGPFDPHCEGIVEAQLEWKLTIVPVKGMRLPQGSGGA